ncbi:phosphatase [Clostridium baratii]|uniref:PHP domain-containing protein n=1 Tax=Clostridium baratii TaxID=1561 RepID=UPI0009A436BE|nr:PHP domain-containing protein [Clostridium baratii]OPF52536.1 phosphatase [Clostridium baratii]OPF55984.1 phosphatase [Clostridium baratii]OPF58422.1 phosphatase [Clostridium baratii]OPF59634.1 phosphatase [Clostridium baratii]
MKKVDFHVHTNFSDGLLSPKDVVKRASKNGVSILAITDHDTIDGISEAIEESKLHNIKIIPGIELSTNYNGESIHVLGYFKNDSYKEKEFVEFLDKIKNRRIHRAKEMIQKLKDVFNIEIKFEDVIKYGENVVARPHIAKAIIDAGYPYTQDYIFDNFIGKGKPAYIETTKITVKEGVDLLHKYNALVFLAHPILINNSNISDFLKFNFDGIEGVYFLNSKTQEKELLDFASKNNLLVSAGSDCHGDFINDSRHGDIGDMNLDENYINLILEKLNC